ncbi:MoaD/ThiS family protein [Limnohabitans radicicola]|uniref:Molybdopterin synthase sulfur carrier subunit n=1 Tax=Limnohabitans radicicola TaxID=2771427 RepID=A0A927IM71_9BURK|nr:MoaD/ThiS family protein [Limnohabitans radicicola]MBD8050870.1 MoaD/ThiS family protein [Limnohabitans radicicola]
MNLQVRYFASIREALGLSSEMVESHARDVAGLLNELRARGGAYAEVLAEGRPVRVAVNQVMATPSTPVAAGAEVGFFPPVTGG